MGGSTTGDAVHFLERLVRVSDEQRELALGLFWQPRRVRWVLGVADLPAGDGRVALPLNERDQGPFLLVERSGRFVTCLAEGMRHDLPSARAVLASWPQRVLEDVQLALYAPDEVRELMAESSRDGYVEIADRMGLPDGLRFERPEDVPLDLALSLRLCFPSPVLGDPERLSELVLWTPWLARFEGPELFMPRELMDAGLREKLAYTKEMALEVLGRQAALCDHFHGALVPYRKAAPEPGRNDPCPCGSGKKHKRCCLGKEPAAAEASVDAEEEPGA